jgi:hypothetical protein
VFAYEFAEPTGEVTEGFPDGARHGADVPYFFDSYFRESTPKIGSATAPAGAASRSRSAASPCA